MSVVVDGSGGAVAGGKPLNPGARAGARALARRLLNGGVAGPILTRSILTGLVIYAVGCVIPAPLEAETKPVGGYPVIVDGSLDTNRGFGTFSVPKGKMFPVEVQAFDANVDDALFAGLYARDGSENYFPLWPVQRMTPIIGDLSKRAATFGPAPFCCLIAGPSCSVTNQLVTVFVARDSIPSSPQLKIPPFTTPFFNFQSWELSCVQ